MRTLAVHIRDTYAKLTNHLWGTSLIYLLSRIIPAALQLVSVTLFVRLLGEGEYGRYALAATLVFLAGGIGSAWIGHSAIRYYRLYADRGSQPAFEAALRAATWMSVVVVSTGLLVVLVLRQADWVGVVCALLAAAALVHYTVMQFIRQALINPRAVLVAETVRAAVMLLVPLALIWIGSWTHYAALLIGLAAGSAAGSYFLMQGMQRSSLAEGFRQREMLRRFAGFGLPLSLLVGISLLIAMSDRFVIEWGLGHEAVGAYTAVYDVVYKATNLLLVPVLLAAHPMIMDAWNSGKGESALHLVRRAEMITLALAVPIALGWTLLARPVLRLVLGHTEALSLYAVALIALGAIIWQLAMIAHKPLEIRERTGLMCVLACVALLVQVGINVLFIPRFGIIVAPCALITGAAVYFVAVKLVAARGDLIRGKHLEHASPMAE